MDVLVDTSVWIDYFRGNNNSEDMDFLIDENLIVTNEIILAELLPYLKIKKQSKLMALLQKIKIAPLNIHWNGIIEDQIKCLEGGVNGIGIPDLIIAQNARQNGCLIYALDKHFKLMNRILEIQLYPNRS